MAARSSPPPSRRLAPLRFLRSTRARITLTTVLATGLLLSLLALGAYSFLQTVQHSSLRNEGIQKLYGLQLDLEQGKLPEANQSVERLPVEISVGNQILYSDPLLASLKWAETLNERLPDSWIRRGDQVASGTVERFPFNTSESWHPWANTTLDVLYTDIPADLVPLDLPENQQVVRISLVVFDFTHESLMEFLPRGLSIAVLGTTLIIAAVSYAAVTWSLRPVDKIRRKLRQLSAENLTERLWVPQTGDEIQALAEEGNAALERLEAADRRQQQFIANAAHDLRSPLASLYSTLEISRLYPNSQPAEQTLAQAETQVKRLVALSEQLLELERLKAAPERSHYDIEIRQLLTQALELHPTPWHVSVDITDTVPRQVRLQANHQHVASAIGNVLANAQRHAASLVTLTAQYELVAAASPGSAPVQLVITIANDGAEIPSADRQRIFERFTRLDESRTTSTGGSGLGLAIAAQIMDSAGGSIGTDREAGLTKFVLTFPVSEAPPQTT